MHRTLSSLTRRIERTLAERLIPATYSHRTPVDVAASHLPGEPVPVAEGLALAYEPFAVGQVWGRPWGTTWFRFTGEVPAAMTGRRVELLVDLGFENAGPGFRSEGLAYTAEGRVIKGVEPRTAYVPISNPAVGGEPVDIYLEAAANPRFTGAVSALGDPLTAGDAPLYRLDRAELAVLEEEVHALVLDVQVLHSLAETLAESDPRRHAIRAALEDMLDTLDVQDVVGGAAAARAVLAPALAAPAEHSAHRVTAVGHAHIDSAWLWPVRETIRKCSRTFANVTALAAEHPDLVFACSSAQQYAWMRDHHPQVWQRIREAVAAGTFVPVGGMWVESDTNLPGGEALVRQLTQGLRFFADELGVRPREVWLPDSFGYSGAMPQLARLAGMRWFLSQKMSWNTSNVFPHHTFWWEGIDGTRVFTHFPPADTYSAEILGEELARGVAQFAERGRATRSLLPFGYGDGGGGPTREMLGRARRFADLEGAPRVEVATPDRFFTAAHDEYAAQAPVWSGEMYLEFHRGTYTSQAAMKRGNRRTEHLLREAETWWATAAVRTGAAYPYDELDDLWRQALLLQFHDILPGSSIAWVHRQARETYAALADRLEALIGRALDLLAGGGEPPEPQGQEGRQGQGAGWLAFNAGPLAVDGVAALGAGPDAGPRAGEAAVAVVQDADGVVLDNGLVRVHVGPDGTLHGVRDLVAGREVLAGRGNLLQVHPDTPNDFDAWDVDDFYRRRRRDLDQVTSLELDTSDPVRPRLVVTRVDGPSTFVQEVSVAVGARRVDLRTEVDWQADETLLKVAFPLDVHAERSTAEIQFGHLHRPTHTNTLWDAARFEVCAHRWLHVAEPGYGVALANDATYGHDVTRAGSGDARGAGPTTVRLSLLRAPRYPDPQTDRGRHAFAYALVPGGIEEAIAAGYGLNLPVRRRPGTGHVAPVVTSSSPAVLVEAVKLADDRSGDVVVRLYESRGGRASTTVRPGFAVAAVQVVDLTEAVDDEVAALCPVTVDGPAVQLALRPFQVVTLRLVPAR